MPYMVKQINRFFKHISHLSFNYFSINFKIFQITETIPAFFESNKILFYFFESNSSYPLRFETDTL
jgi:hypothetical protein